MHYKINLKKIRIGMATDASNDTKLSKAYKKELRWYEQNNYFVTLLPQIEINRL